MSRHLTAEEFARYRNRTMAPVELPAVQEHLAACEACRTALLDPARVASAARALQQELESSHLSDQQVEDYVDGVLQADEREAVRDHLEQCAPCRSEESDLRAFKASFAGRHVPGSSWLAAAAAVIVISLVAAVAFFAIQFRKEQRASAANVSDQNLSTAHKAFESKTVEVPGFVKGLIGEKQTLMGKEERLPFDLIRPVGTAVESMRPVFEWEPLAGAQGYQVKIFNSKLELIQESPRLASISWNPATPLPPGEICAWQVSAWQGEREIISPAAPYPAARFLVLDPDRRQKLKQELPACGASHLLRGLCYARFGLLDDADAEFRSLPNSTVAQKLVQNLHSLRHPD